MAGFLADLRPIQGGRSNKITDGGNAKTGTRSRKRIPAFPPPVGDSNEERVP